MADRRTDDRSVAPERPSGAGTTGASNPKGQGSLSRGQERVAAAVAKARDSGRSSRDGDATPTPGGGSTASTATGTKPARGSSARSAPRRVRRARLRLTHIDPWSVMKTAFLLSIALGIVTVVAVGIVWSVLGAAGVWESINRAVADVAGDTGGDFAIEDYLGTSRIMGITMLLAVVDVFLITVVATLGAFLYNLAAALLGGLEIVFAEEDR